MIQIKEESLDTYKLGRLLSLAGAVIAGIMLLIFAVTFLSPRGVSEEDAAWYRESMVNCFTGNYSGHAPIYCPGEDAFFPIFWVGAGLGIVGVVISASSLSSRRKED
jgi:hypothetical protein